MDVEIGFLYKTFIIRSSVCESEWMDANSLEKKERYSTSIRSLVQLYCGY